MEVLSYQEGLKRYDDKQIRKLGELPAFQLLTQKYKSIREASEEELTRAFNISEIRHVEEALGIKKELDDFVEQELERGF